MEKLKPNSRVKFYNITHSYLLDSVFYLMGVTELMRKHHLSADYTDVNEKRMKEARERGTKGHKEIEYYCKGKLKGKPSAVVKAFKELDLKVLESEFLISDNEMIASQIDLILEDYSVVDIKFTSQLHIRPLQWQLSIYAYLLELNYNIKVPKVYALHYDKQDKASLVEIQRLPNSQVEDLFQAEREGRIYEDLPTTPTAADKAVMELHSITTFIEGLKSQIKEAEAKKNELQEAFLKQMEETGTKSIITDFCRITYITESQREGVDTKLLKAEQPEIFEQYKKITIVKPSVRITTTDKDV